MNNLNNDYLNRKSVLMQIVSEISIIKNKSGDFYMHVTAFILISILFYSLDCVIEFS